MGRVLAAELRVPPQRLRRLRQVHGTRTVRRYLGEPSDETAPAADAHWTTDRCVVLVVSAADCCPVLIADASGTVVGAAHAGWKGTVEGVVPSLVTQLSTVTAVMDLWCWIGPCADGSHYEVRTPVAERFSHYPGALRRIPDSAARWLLDLPSVLRQQLITCGVDERQILLSGNGTMTSTRHHSHRRDHFRAGRMAAWATLSVDDQPVP